MIELTDELMEKTHRELDKIFFADIDRYKIYYGHLVNLQGDAFPPDWHIILSEMTENNELINPISGEAIKTISISREKLNNIYNYDDFVSFNIELTNKSSIMRTGQPFRVRNAMNCGIKSLYEIKKDKDAALQQLAALEKENNVLLTQIQINDENNVKLLDKIKINSEANMRLQNEVNQLENYLKKLKDDFEKFGLSLASELHTVKYAIDEIPKYEIAEFVQNYLSRRQEKPLYYNLNILKMFYTALCTKQLVILCGKPGTGKTSLVEGFCEAIGAVCKIIPVKPNWVDNQDLLGFYNPIDKSYVSTPFLDLLVEAEKDPDRLYCICLDEMNLAHVEYYFAELLSQLQTHEPKIELYPKKVFQQQLAEIRYQINLYLDKGINNEDELIDFFRNKKIDDERMEPSIYLKLKNQFAELQKYKPEIEIPENIRFIGTVNKDETTKNLSPKVIDRAFIIEVGALSETMKNEIELLKKLILEPLPPKRLNSALFSANGDVTLTDFYYEFETWLKNLESELLALNVLLSNRFYMQARNFIAVNTGLELNEYIDYIFSCLILPKISISADTMYEKSALKKILDKLKEVESYNGEFDFYYTILDNMEKYFTKTGILTYWR